MGFLKTYGKKLLDNRYPIIPIKKGFKFPKGLSNWQQTEADEQQLNKWLSNGFSDGGVGVLTKRVPAVDIDVQDDEVVEKVRNFVKTRLGDTLERVGMAPKTLLVYRTDEPFSKVTSAEYEDMFGIRHRVEVLGDGQQFVAFAEHPDTKKPYSWLKNASIAGATYDDLLPMTHKDARAIVEFFEANVPDDWERISEGVSGQILTEIDILDTLKPKVDIATSRLKRCLMKLDADEYERWMQVGMALFHQFDGNSDGFDLWDEWSQSSSKYDAKACYDKWPTFDALRSGKDAITAASVIKWAREEERNQELDPLDHFLTNYVYVQDGDRVCDLTKPPHLCISKMHEFKNAMANVRIEIPAPTEKDPDKTVLKPAQQLWLVETDRKTAEGTEYVPKGPRLIDDNYGLTWVNEYHAPEFAEVSDTDKLDLFFQHMEYLFPRENEREWFIQWMAFNVQYPEKRCKVTPLHVAKAHGTGRGWVVELMMRLLGYWNVSKTKMSVLSGEGSSGQYQDYLDKSLLCALEEVKEGNKRFAVSDKIRDILTENYLEVNIKYGGKKSQQVFTNFFFMSNHPDALVLTKEDRRINVFEGPEKPKTRPYYDALYAWLDTDGVSALYHHLMALDLNRFNWLRAIETPARDKMIEANQSDTERLFWELINHSQYQALTQDQMKQVMADISGGDTFDFDIDEGQLRKLCQHHLYGPRRLKIDGKVVRIWAFNSEVSSNDTALRAEVKKCEL